LALIVTGLAAEGRRPIARRTQIAEGDADNISVKVANTPAEELAGGQCDAQLFLPTSDAWLVAIDPETGASAIDQMLCRIKFRSLRYEGQYTPPSEQGTIVYPGHDLRYDAVATSH